MLVVYKTKHGAYIDLLNLILTAAHFLFLCSQDKEIILLL